MSFLCPKPLNIFPSQSEIESKVLIKDSKLWHPTSSLILSSTTLPVAHCVTATLATVVFVYVVIWWQFFLN